MLRLPLRSLERSPGEAASTPAGDSLASWSSPPAPAGSVNGTWARPAVQTGRREAPSWGAARPPGARRVGPLITPAGEDAQRRALEVKPGFTTLHVTYPPPFEEAG